MTARTGDVLDVLSRLVDKSLVNVDSDVAGSRRYRFLETVRQYARERLLRIRRSRSRRVTAIWRFFTSWFDAPSRS